MKSTVLIGLGNLLMSDEGVGVHVVHALLNSGRLPADVVALDLGPGGLTVLHAMTGFARAIFIDCAFMNLPAGEWRQFQPEAARTVKVRGRQSLHEGDLMEILDLATGLNRLPNEVVIFGIQPASVEPGERLTAALQNKMGEYQTAILQEVGSA
ncbi:MAG: hydrogenase maturation protease [Planctomycetes bacterium]|nr:hydrogenase maturation protease [Planctomycetota bacterium]